MTLVCSAVVADDSVVFYAVNFAFHNFFFVVLSSHCLSH